nr:hypothetical protein [Tanacetum cinerariifolium]
MLLSKLKCLNPTQITHPFSKSRLGFCNSLSITQQQQKQDDEETIKEFTSILNGENFISEIESFLKPLNPNLVQTIILRNRTCQARLLFHFLDKSSTLKSQNLESYLLVSNRCVESTSDPSDLTWARRTLRDMVCTNKPPDILDAMKSFGLSSSLFTRLIYTYTYRRMFDEAVYLLLNYKNGDCFPDLDCLNILMERLLNVDFNCILYNNVINGYIKIGETEDAKTVLLEMKEKDCSPDLVTYNVIIGGFLEQGEADEVFNLKNEMVATGIKVDVETFVCIIKGLFKLGECKDAIKLLGGMKDDGVLPMLIATILLHVIFVRQKELRKFGI